MSKLVPEDLQTPLLVSPLHLKELGSLKSLKAGMGQVERNGYPRHPVGAKPLIREPKVGFKI
jgi:hypothetical protein